jgi:hypothetical protein
MIRQNCLFNDFKDAKKKNFLIFFKILINEI